jgi:hypothetical protein
MLCSAQTCCEVTESMYKEKVTSLPCFKLWLLHQTLIRHSSETLHALIGPDQTIRHWSDTNSSLGLRLLHQACKIGILIAVFGAFMR